jgi:tetratricopeptide (TPR) repeat protein
MARPTFVARENVLNQLQAFLDRALAGQGQVCFVTGEAGSGKTALVGEFTHRAQQAHPDLLFAVGSCNAQTGLGDPYLPFREILDLLFGDVQTKLAQKAISDENANRLSRFLVHSGEILIEVAPDLVGALVPGSKLVAVLGKALANQFGWTDRLERLVRRKESSPPGGEAPIEQTQIFQQYTKALSALAARQPLLLAVDDLQWADTASISLLFHLGRQITEGRILLIGCYRPADVAIGRAGQRHPLESVVNEFTRYLGDISVDLNRAAEEEGRRFVDALLDTEPNRLGEAFRNALYQHTGGHALFTIELLRGMEDSGDLRKDEAGLWVEGPSLDWSRLPTRVESVIDERVGRLDSALRQALTVGSVEGIEFTAEVIARVQNLDSKGLVRRLSSEAEKMHHLVHDLGMRRVGTQRLSLYRFWHSLFQTFLYGGLDEAERSYLHEDVGNALEALYGDQTDQIALRLAWHFEQAGLADKAINYLCQAGQQALALYAPLEAVQILTRGLQMAQRLAVPVPPQLLHARGQAYQIVGEFGAAQADLEAALQEAQAITDTHMEWQVLLDLGQLWASRDYARAGQYFQRALERAQALGDSAPVARSLNRVGNWQMNIGQPAEALRYHGEALETFRRLGDQPGLAETLDLLGMASYMVGDVLKSDAYYHKALDLYRELKDAQGLAAVLGAHTTNLDYLTETVLINGERQSRCEVDGLAALDMARDLGWRSGEAFALFGLGACLVPRGEYARALEYSQDSLRLALEIEHHQWTVGAHTAFGAIYIDLLAPEQALQHLDKAQALAEDIGSQFWLWSTVAMRARTHVLQDDLEGAEAILGSLLEPDTPFGTLGHRLAWSVRAELALAMGDPDLALIICDQLISSAANLAAGQAIPALSRLRGQALLALGRIEKAEAELQAALAAAQAVDARPMTWRIHAALGQLYRAADKPEQAERELTAARHIVEELAAHIPDTSLRENFMSRAIATWQS